MSPAGSVGPKRKQALEPESILSIGDLVKSLKEEFTNISVSKVRFLENEGLVSPIRSKGGYRRFTTSDRERLRSILRMQNQEYLPLSVIKERLDAEGEVLTSSEAQAAQSTILSSAGSQSRTVPEGFPSEGVDLSELARISGISSADAAELLKHGMIKGMSSSAGRFYGSEDLEICLAAKDLGRFGLEPRHLKLFANFSGREAALCRQALGPVSRRTPESTHRAQQALRDIVVGLDRLRDSLLHRALRDEFPDII